MPKAGWITAWLILALGASALAGAQLAFEYPSALLDAYDADEGCWVGMGLTGLFPETVVPRQWLVGPPPSDRSAVTLPTDHWVSLLFAGELVRADGVDLEIVEWGAADERAIVFVTDGADQEYALGIAHAAASGGQIATHIGMEFPDFPVGFVPRGLRIVALDRGGTAPGFDVANVRAWVRRDCGEGPRFADPADGLADVPLDATLSWLPACGTDVHTIYFGTDRRAVEHGAAETQYDLIGPDANCFDPPALELGRTYYWRVAEADSAAGSDVRLGDVWSFTVTDRIAIDDFETYVDGGPSLYDAWYPQDRAQASLDQGVFHSCRQALTFGYYYDNWYEGSYSEVYRVFEQTQDWTQGGAEALEFWLYGYPSNSTTGQLYVVVSDGGVYQTAPCPSAASLLTTAVWQPCRVPLAEFTAVDLTRVESIGIGISRPLDLPKDYGSGVVILDDISLRPTICRWGPVGANEYSPVQADLNGDCVIDARDLDSMAAQWLSSDVVTASVTAPNEPILWYKFDGDMRDSAGSAHGQAEGRPMYAAGKHGQAIHFQTAEDLVSVSQVGSVFGSIRDAITISFWQYGDDSFHLNDTICCSNYVYGQSNPSIAIHLGCWRQPGQYRWDCGTPWSLDNRLAGRHTAKAEWAGQWNHWAFVKDAVAGKMDIYLNGLLYDSRTGANSPIEGITSFAIGSGWYGRYDGLLDDFQIYDYALGAEEVAYLASDGTGLLQRATAPAADLDASGTVDLADYALLAAAWRDIALWP